MQQRSIEREQPPWDRWYRHELGKLVCTVGCPKHRRREKTGLNIQIGYVDPIWKAAGSALGGALVAVAVAFNGEPLFPPPIFDLFGGVANCSEDAFDELLDWLQHIVLTTLPPVDTRPIATECLGEVFFKDGIKH